MIGRGTAGGRRDRAGAREPRVVRRQRGRGRVDPQRRVRRRAACSRADPRVLAERPGLEPSASPRPGTPSPCSSRASRRACTTPSPGRRTSSALTGDLPADRRGRGAPAARVGLRPLPARHRTRLRRRGDGPCVIFMTGARREGGTIEYPRSEAALAHGAGVETGTGSPARGLRAVRRLAPGPPGGLVAAALEQLTHSSSDHGGELQRGRERRRGRGPAPRARRGRARTAARASPAAPAACATRAGARVAQMRSSPSGCGPCRPRRRARAARAGRRASRP